MKVLILGATSPAGQQTVSHFFTRYPNGKAVLYVRNPSKLPPHISSSHTISIIQGELTELEKLESCFAAGSINAVISTLGPNLSTPFEGTPIADFYRVLLPIMAKHHTKRLVAIATPSFPDPHDRFGLIPLISLLFSWLMPNPGREVRAMVGAIQEEGNNHGVDWTVGRVFMLKDEPLAKNASIKAGYVADGSTGWSISREAIGKWWIDQIESKEWVGKVPYVSGG